MTPDQFARRFVEEMDFPADRKVVLVMEIAKQIRSQLEEYAGVALHPLFHGASSAGTLPPSLSNGVSSAVPGNSTPRLINGLGSATNGTGHTNGTNTPKTTPHGITASAERIPTADADDRHNLDDTYRCIVNLSVNLLNKLYSDRFEWSLVHPPGIAEAFARQTCADLGLGSEWVMAMAHAIYEAVLRLRKDVCENGGMLLGYGELDNEAVFGGEAGWRFDPETLGEGWEPKLEELSKEEIEKREGDRERQLRRARRETARFSSTTNMAPANQGEYFTFDSQDQPMGRGERSKKKRRFRSLSPLGRDTPDGSSRGYGGENGSLAEQCVSNNAISSAERLTLSQRTAILALRPLCHLGLRGVGRAGRSKRRKGKSSTAPTSGCSADGYRRSATIVASSSKGTRNSRRGRRTSSLTSTPMALCDGDGRSLAERTSTKVLQGRSMWRALCSRITEK